MSIRSLSELREPLDDHRHDPIALVHELILESIDKGISGPSQATTQVEPRWAPCASAVRFTGEHAGFQRGPGISNPRGPTIDGDCGNAASIQGG